MSPARGQPAKLATATDSGNCSPGPIAQVRQTTRVEPVPINIRISRANRLLSDRGRGSPLGTITPSHRRSLESRQISRFSSGPTKAAFSPGNASVSPESPNALAKQRAR